GPDARSLGKFPGGVSSQSARAADHPTEPYSLARHGCGAGHLCDAGENSAYDRRAWPRRQHRRRGDEQPEIAVRAVALIRSLQELQDLSLFFSGEISADTHVQSGHFPLGVTKGSRRTHIMAKATALTPKLSAAFGVNIR